MLKELAFMHEPKTHFVNKSDILCNAKVVESVF